MLDHSEYLAETYLPRLRQKIEANGYSLEVGTNSYSLEPVLSEGEVAAFESAHGILLPEAYRFFLTHVSNGGGGLVELGTAPAYASRPEGYWTHLPDIGKPFPFTHGWYWEEGEDSDEGEREQVSYGSLWLTTDGCGMDWHLIVTGPERGHVWWVSGEGMTPTNPKRDFLRWYEDWLDGMELLG
jgi:hypothetical protein